MALIKCPECGHQVSDKANACPNCGYPLLSVEPDSLNVAEKPTSINQKEAAWISDLKKKAKRSKRTTIILIFVFFAIAVTFSLLLVFDKKATYHPYSGVTSYSVKTHWSVLTVYSWIFSFFYFIIGWVAAAYKKVVVDYHDDKVIAIYRRLAKPVLYINGEKKFFEGSKRGVDHIEYRYRFEDGELLIVTVQAKNTLIDYFYNGSRNVQNQTIVNNYITNNTINKKAKKAQRSDMEKILIKNAKIDALASIDPTDSKKAKEQLDIVNKLDNLD